MTMICAPAQWYKHVFGQSQELEILYLINILSCCPQDKPWRSNEKLWCHVRGNSSLTVELSPLFACKISIFQNHSNKEFSKAPLNGRLLLWTRCLQGIVYLNGNSATFLLYMYVCNAKKNFKDFYSTWNRMTTSVSFVSLILVVLNAR